MRALGKQIAVLAQGFVYVGDCFWDGDFLKISNAHNLRVWGTTHGLSQLTKGPTKDTKADPCGTVLVPKTQVVHFLEVVSGW